MNIWKKRGVRRQIFQKRDILEKNILQEPPIWGIMLTQKTQRKVKCAQEME